MHTVCKFIILLLYEELKIRQEKKEPLFVYLHAHSIVAAQMCHRVDINSIAVV